MVSPGEPPERDAIPEFAADLVGGWLGPPPYHRPDLPADQRQQLLVDQFVLIPASDPVDFTPVCPDRRWQLGLDDRQ